MRMKTILHLLVRVVHLFVPSRKCSRCACSGCPCLPDRDCPGGSCPESDGSVLSCHRSHPGPVRSSPAPSSSSFLYGLGCSLILSGIGSYMVKMWW